MSQTTSRRSDDVDNHGGCDGMQPRNARCGKRQYLELHVIPHNLI